MRYEWEASIKRATRDADGRIIRDERGMSVQETVRATVIVDVDIDAIIKRAAETATKNRTGTARLLGGLVTAKSKGKPKASSSETLYAQAWFKDKRESKGA